MNAIRWKAPGYYCLWATSVGQRNGIRTRMGHQGVLFSAIFFLSFAFVYPASAKEFGPASGQIDFCNKPILSGKGIDLGPPLLTLSDYENDRPASSYKGVSSRGAVIPLGVGSPYKTSEQARLKLTAKTLTEKNPVDLPIDENISPKTLRVQACFVLENKFGEAVILDRWMDQAISNLLYLQSLIFSTRDVGETISEWKSPAVFEFIKNPDGSQGKLLSITLVDGPGKIRSVFYTVKGNRGTLSEIGKRASINFTFRPLNQADPRDIGLYQYNKIASAKYHETGTLVPRADILAVEVTHSWDGSKGLGENTRNIVRRTKNISPTVLSTTQIQLELEGAERNLFGDNPNGDRLLLCEIQYGKNSSKCDAYR